MVLEKAHKYWPGPDENDQLIVVEMLSNPSSLHWHECRHFLERVIQVSSIAPDSKEDVVQNTMISVMTYLPGFRYQCRLQTWLIRIAQSRIADAYRDKTRRSGQIILLSASSDDDDNENEIDKIHQAPLTTEETCILRETLEEAMEGLNRYLHTHANSARNRQIAEKVLLNEYGFQEAARELGIPAPVVRYIALSVRDYLQGYIREKMDS